MTTKLNVRHIVTWSTATQTSSKANCQLNRKTEPIIVTLTGSHRHHLKLKAQMSNKLKC